jgi:hypothetical protein
MRQLSDIKILGATFNQSDALLADTISSQSMPPYNLETLASVAAASNFNKIGEVQEADYILMNDENLIDNKEPQLKST